MKTKFLNKSIESYLKPKSEDEIIHSLYSLSKEELNQKLVDTAKNGFIVAAQYIIKVLRDVNIKDENGNTALHLASFCGHRQIVKMLLDAGADVNYSEVDGYTALHYASYSGHRQIVKMLLDAGVDINIKDKKGRTALYWALHKNKKDLVNLLEKRGAK